MLNYIKNIFTSNSKKLSDSMYQDLIVRTAIKQPYYHEIIGNTVKIYSRTEGYVMEEESVDPIKTSITLLNKYNKGVA
jgi:hypothetical protein